jgi:hypothetical protein
MVMVDERREHEIDLAERAGKIWGMFRDILAERARGLDGVAANATASAVADRAGADDAGAKATAATDRLERWRRGEDAPRGREIELEKNSARSRTDDGGHQSCEGGLRSCRRRFCAA